MYNKILKTIEKQLYNPNAFGFIVAILLLPLSFIYSFVVFIKKLASKKEDFKIPIISIGNIVLGGSGKTPFTKALYKYFSKDKKIYIILRGYKRQSKGLILVCKNGEILTDVKTSGDEAMEYATTLKNANIIVSENRKVAIKKAIDLGADLILLDDGFSKFNIKKFDILLEPQNKPKLPFSLPSAAYRYPIFFYKFANLIIPQNQIKRKTFIINETQKMLLVTAIANPQRLKEYFPKVIDKVFFMDHYDFKEDELKTLLNKYNATSILLTRKDYVKVKDFDINFSIIELEISINKEILNKIKDAIA